MMPCMFIPAVAGDFIGSANKLARILERKADALRMAPCAVKLLVIGAPGTGKTALLNSFAGRLAGHSCQIETLNGRDLTIETVRQWRKDACYRPLCGGYSIKLVNELDLATPAAQDLLLSYLDDLPPWIAFLATSNLNLSALAERFQTRLQQFRLSPPAAKEIAALVEGFGVDSVMAAQIADKAKGNVRAALLDAQSILDARELNVIELRGAA